MAETTQTFLPDTQLFRDVFDASPIGIVVENLEGQPLLANPFLCSMLGFTEQEMRSKRCVEFSPPEDAEKDWAQFERLRAGLINRYQIEKRFIRKDGSLVWGRLSISMLNCTPPLVVAMVEDITEKRKAEEARLRHAAIVESSEDAIVSKNLDGVIESWNTGAQHVFGYTESEAIGQPITVLIPPGLWDEERNMLERLRRGEHIEHYETIRVTKAGTRVHVSLSISPVRDSDGKIVGFSKIARDITDRKRHEMALRTSEERLRLAQQAASIATFEWNIQTGVNIWTPELEAMYGLPLGGFGGTQTAFENLIHPDDRARIIELNDSALKTGLPTRGEWRVVWPDGSVHWIAGRWRVFMDESGKSSRMIGVNADITERKLAEQALADMTRRLIQAQEEERARIGRDLHDNINQQIAMLAVELTQLQQCPSEVESRVQALRKGMAELSGDVQALSHDLHSSKLEYLGVVAGIKSWCKEFSERQKMEIDFTSDAPSALPHDIGLSLFRVLQEALHNVCKHSGVKRVQVRLQIEADEIHLTISDLGKGFEVEPALRGKGLGLTSMRERVRLVNGTFSIQSEPMSGTTIHVRVPLGQQHGTRRKAV